MLKRFWKDESAQGMTEYILIVALIAVAAIVMVKAFGGKIGELFSKSTGKIEKETTDSFK
ncbi:MAG: Flp family type IVb pilin [Endomicrobiales bacterium]|nr:Flp family type IVb pilin [Endomicrobiales bacterium]